MKNAHHVRTATPVNLYTLKGEYILTFESLLEAATVLNVSRTQLKEAINKDFYIKGYQVGYYNGQIYDVEPSPRLVETVYKKYKVTNKINEPVETFDSPKEIVEYFGASENAVQRAIKFKTCLFNRYKIVEYSEKITNSINEFKDTVYEM